MKKIVLGVLIGITILALSGVATAMLIPAADRAKEKARAENSPVIEKVEIEGLKHLALSAPGLEKIVFVHHKKDFAKPPWAGGGKEGKKEPACYGFLGRGVSWKDLSINYVVHPDLEATVPGAVFAGAEAWDAATSKELFSNDYVVDETATWDSDAPDGRNEFVFGNYPQEGVIGVAVVWGYFSGPPSSRKIIEFDVLFDTDFTWGDAVIDPAVMDLQNIATHEIGHGIGLGDIYETACSEVTMYGYSDFGEIKKRTLEQPDITGTQKLYGGF